MNQLNNVPFFMGLIIGIILSIIVSIIDYTTKFNGLCSDCDNDFGFPFTWYKSGSFIHRESFNWGVLVINVLLLLIISVLVGVLFQVVWNKYKSRKQFF